MTSDRKPFDTTRCFFARRVQLDIRRTKRSRAWQRTKANNAGKKNEQQNATVDHSKRRCDAR